MGHGILTTGLRRAAALGGLAAVALAVLARPAVYEVEGVSMAPSLLPGDRASTAACGLADRFRRPRRFDRWVLSSADGAAAIKRIVGLPGERLGIVAGDLVVGATPVLKPPLLLAEIGTPLAAPSPFAAGRWRMPPREILDEDAHDPGRSVVLLPVRDVGFAAEVTGAGRARATVGRTTIAWRLAAGRHAILAGRLDGHVVAVAWRLAENGTVGPGRSCLPPRVPGDWSAAVPWPEADATGDRTPLLELDVEPCGAAAARIERIGLWRDVHWRPAATGVAAWTIGSDCVFVLGDHPAASRDSRHWGPVPMSALRHRIAVVTPAER
jgi:type IV secretory pathway protease TraF